jgi:hypothetical protein
MEKLSEGRGDKPAEGDYVTVHYVLKEDESVAEAVAALLVNHKLEQK